MTPHKTEVGVVACKSARYSGIHQVNQPFIMYAAPGELELPLYSGLSTVQMRERKQASCIKVLPWFDIITLSLAKLNNISFYRSHTANFYSMRIQRHPPLLTVNTGLVLDCWMRYS